MIRTLQRISLPDEGLYEHWALFYRGSRGVIVQEGGEQRLCVNRYETVEFNTYFNSVSQNKWKKYTSINKIFVVLDVEGEFDLCLCGYSLQNDQPIRKVISMQHVNEPVRAKVRFAYEENSESMLAFEIRTTSEVKFYGGHYEGEFEQEQPNEVELAISTTTCWKEDYVKKNIRILYDELLCRDYEISSHLSLHIVDNGRTLSEEDFPKHERIHYHRNPNTGGSGGYARGMMEAKHQQPYPTYVLLMDDDIVVIPDSIYRTFVLLQTVKPEYKDHFIGGAMLILEERNVQHEDIGTAMPNGNFAGLKPRMYHNELRCNLLNEEEYYANNQYQAWWYCCIPMKAIEENGLALPIFIRGDDCEFSLRNKAKIISMNGICLWHMGFYGKYSASMNIYQECRNLLIANASTGVLETEPLIDRVNKFYRVNILKHDYNAAQLALMAWEDFMKGPDYLAQIDGEKQIKENGKLNQKMEPLSKFKGIEVNLFDVYGDVPRRFFKTLLYRITYNGHRFFPDFLLNDEVQEIPFDFGYTPGKMALKRTYLAVNPMQKTACLKPIDKKRFHELQRRRCKDLHFWRKNRKNIMADYAAKRDYLVSEEFWRKYLGLDA